MSVEFVAATSRTQIERISHLAAQIWQEYYVPLIGQAQVDYMVATFQSTDAMLDQLAQGYLYFTVEHGDIGSVAAADNDVPLGYFAVQPRPCDGNLFISKLYLQRAQRGRGTGRVTLEFIERMARAQASDYVWLTVNKGNPAVRTYQKWGFQVTQAVVMDIGGGFVMDDYRMEKRIQSSR